MPRLTQRVYVANARAAGVRTRALHPAVYNRRNPPRGNPPRRNPPQLSARNHAALPNVELTQEAAMVGDGIQMGCCVLRVLERCERQSLRCEHWRCDGNDAAIKATSRRGTPIRSNFLAQS